jgi:hypothetical protein
MRLPNRGPHPGDSSRLHHIGLDAARRGNRVTILIEVSSKPPPVCGERDEPQSPTTVLDVKRQERIEPEGPLAGHIRKGRRFLPSLAATGVLDIADWIRNDLPDLVWPVLTLSETGSVGAIKFVRWQGAVQRDLAGRASPETLANGLDGRLTSLERLSQLVPGSQVDIKNRAAEFGLLPESAVRVLASYPERPAAWLLDLEVMPPGQPEVDLLARAILDVLSDGHREAIIKCLSIWSAVQAGTFRSDRTAIDLLKYYPNDLATRSQADTVIRAMWGALRGLRLREDPGCLDRSIEWARIFWAINSMTTRCIRSRDDDQGSDANPDLGEDDELDERSSSGDDADTQGTDPYVDTVAVPEDGKHLRRLAMDLMSSYAQALETSPSDLYERERQEVHAGLVSRASREVMTALGAPEFWCLEHGAHLRRTLVEIRVYLEWMALQGLFKLKRGAVPFMLLISAVG